MSDTRDAMREFRFLDEKRKLGTLSALEENRLGELRQLLGIAAPESEASAYSEQGYYAEDGNWYPYPSNFDPAAYGQYAEEYFQHYGQYPDAGVFAHYINTLYAQLGYGYAPEGQQGHAGDPSAVDDQSAAQGWPTAGAPEVSADSVGYHEVAPRQPDELVRSSDPLSPEAFHHAQSTGSDVPEHGADEVEQVTADARPQLEDAEQLAEPQSLAEPSAQRDGQGDLPAGLPEPLVVGSGAVRTDFADAAAYSPNAPPPPQPAESVEEQAEVIADADILDVTADALPFADVDAANIAGPVLVEGDPPSSPVLVEPAQAQTEAVSAVIDSGRGLADTSRPLAAASVAVGAEAENEFAFADAEVLTPVPRPTTRPAHVMSFPPRAASGQGRSSTAGTVSARAHEDTPPLSSSQPEGLATYQQTHERPGSELPEESFTAANEVHGEEATIAVEAAAAALDAAVSAIEHSEDKTPTSPTNVIAPAEAEVGLDSGEERTEVDAPGLDSVQRAGQDSDSMPLPSAGAKASEVRLTLPSASGFDLAQPEATELPRPLPDGPGFDLAQPSEPPDVAASVAPEPVLDLPLAEASSIPGMAASAQAFDFSPEEPQTAPADTFEARSELEQTVGADAPPPDHLFGAERPSFDSAPQQQPVAATPLFDLAVSEEPAPLTPPQEETPVIDLAADDSVLGLDGSPGEQVPLTTASDFVETQTIRGDRGFDLDGDPAEPLPLASNADFLEMAELRGTGAAWGPDTLAAKPSSEGPSSSDTRQTIELPVVSPPSDDDATWASESRKTLEFQLPTTAEQAEPGGPPVLERAAASDAIPEEAWEDVPLASGPISAPSSPMLASAEVMASEDVDLSDDWASPRSTLLQAPAPEAQPILLTGADTVSEITLEASEIEPEPEPEEIELVEELDDPAPIAVQMPIATLPARTPPAPPAAALTPSAVLSKVVPPPPPPQALRAVAPLVQQARMLTNPDEVDFDSVIAASKHQSFGDGRAILSTTFVEGEHRVILHTVEGQVKRGTIRDVDLMDSDITLEQPSGAPEQIPSLRVKAIFFMLPQGQRPPDLVGSKIRVTFTDGRQVAGFSSDYSNKADPGFFIIPADNRTNTARIYVFRTSIQAVALA